MSCELELRRWWAGRLARALRGDDGDAFIVAYDDLLADPAGYSDDQVEAIKDMARALYDSGQELAAEGAPALDGACAVAMAPSSPADKCSGAQHAGERALASSSVRADTSRPQPVSSRTIGVQAELWESPPSLQRDAVKIMLRERWLQGMGRPDVLPDDCSRY
ncbi:hypothetical protein T492DRAFT_1046413 [Pavlovales sp. CCMP2436]|nr:hypothetical protein T492DRAFT_1046413 [Pavlovales sp. CCMP2436]|mmetsp:Transcript_4889/g.12551  ORF Transcript_4889/g.12551 Transcript_4889/m.12551 type:complete len:163 (+) Transcript_4889:35-523(+)|eukprot:CAMPEP_0179951962 /NCGR_PEP_ID=MMETSP0983-20121128/23976_1 /TAXON_ID=483367 /ORGANISM="non described non described, Strain CCMP 2436" /LENGTH=162 /DNA_ID=CAMNT_0021862459 /DNA_START=28 /DNA_END=516 /DNA_ORIENTATION=-